MSIINNFGGQFNPLGQFPQLPPMTPQARTPQQMQMYNQALQNYGQPQMIRPGNSVSAQTANTPSGIASANTPMQTGDPLGDILQSDSTILFNPDAGSMGNPQGGYDGGGINPGGMYDGGGVNPVGGPYYSDLRMGEGGFNPGGRNPAGNQGGYDGGGINPVIGPNGERLLDMKEAGTGPFEGLPQGTPTGEVGMADPTPDLSNNPPAEAAPAMPESALSQLDPIPEDMPNTGLIGYEEAVGGGYDDAVQSYLNAYRGSPGVQGSRDFDIEQTQNAVNALSGYNQGGAEAQQRMAALSGALGPEAQAEAMANFQESPGQQYLREQTERGVLRNAAAVGGLGGGNVLKALQSNAAGLAAQDFQNQFNRLANVADRGFSSAGRTADLYGSLGGRQAGFRNEMGSRIAEAQIGKGTMLGANRTRVGEKIADNIAATASQIAAQQGGQDLANLLGGDANALISLINAAQSGDAASNEALAAILANIATQSGSQVAGRPSPGIGNDPGYLETIGKAVAGVGTGIGATQTPSPSDPRLKTDIHKLGKHNGHNLYSWKWNEEGRRLTGLEYGAGVMADEVLEKDPAAVSMQDGYLAVNYSRIF
jgi:hypothetical protein